MPVLGVGMGYQGLTRVVGALEGTYEKWRWSIAKYSWQLKDGLLHTMEHEVRLTRRMLVPTRYLYLGALRGPMWVMGLGVHQAKHQPGPQADDMSCWSAVVLLLTTRCLPCWWGSQGPRGGVGALGVTYEKWRWTIAKYSWKLKTVYYRQ